jgi:hypothetical protein
MPSTITAGMSSNGIVAVPSGSGGVASQNGQAQSLQVPQDCTAGNFKVVQFGAANTSTADVNLVQGSDNSVNGFLFDTIRLFCTLTANNGGFSTCSTANTSALTGGQLIAIFTRNFSNLPDFQNAHFLVSFTCQ